MKKNFNWRLDCPERAYQGGFRRIQIGALFGLAPWRREAVALARASGLFAEALLESRPFRGFSAHAALCREL